MSEQKLFNIFVNKMQFEPADYLVASTETDLSKFQKQMIENATTIMQDNIVGDIKSFGGNLKKNEEKFKDFEKKANEELENEDYDAIKKDLKDYIKKLKELIDKTCIAFIPVKQMPWVDVVFRTIPRITFEKNTQLLDNSIAYYGEIKCVIARPTIFGKIKDEKPLFAPIMGSLDLGGYKIDDSEKRSKSEIFPYITAVIKSLDSSVSKSHLAKYATSFQRHGDPICDFLMKDDELMSVMEKLTSSIESNRLSSDMAINGITIPYPSEKVSLTLVSDEGEDENRFAKCFEAFLKFSAESCRIPSLSHESSTQPPQPTSPSGPPQPGAVRTPGGQELKTWTAEDLAAEAQKRMTSQPDMPMWSEEDLTKFSAERGTGLPEGMEVWDEKDLVELARKRQGGLDIPEWEDDKNLGECLKCGYALRAGWTRCPVCETPVGVKPESDDQKDQKIVEESSENNSDEAGLKPQDSTPEEK